MHLCTMKDTECPVVLVPLFSDPGATRARIHQHAVTDLHMEEGPVLEASSILLENSGRSGFHLTIKRRASEMKGKLKQLLQA